MWTVEGQPVDAGRFGSFEPKRVLNYCDGPRIFTFYDADGGLCLACWSDGDDSVSRFIVVPVSDRIISELESGLLTVREALAQPRTWCVDCSSDDMIVNAWLVNPDLIPANAMPRARVMLYRSLDPILSLRATGESIHAGETPGSVIASTVVAAQRAIKCLAEYEMDLGSPKGRPSRALQKLYDLPVQKTLAASFEVQFRSPLNEPGLFDGLEEDEIQEERDVLARVGQHLQTGLAWLSQTGADVPALPEADNETLSRAIVKALKFLTPSARGPVGEMEIRGAMVTNANSPVRLTKQSRSVLNGAMSRLPTVKKRRVELPGRIRELNEKLLRFELHPIEDGASVVRVCSFKDDLWDDVYECLGSAETVIVVGLEMGPASVVDVFDVFRESESGGG